MKPVLLAVHESPPGPLVERKEEPGLRFKYCSNLGNGLFLQLILGQVLDNLSAQGEVKSLALKWECPEVALNKQDFVFQIACFQLCSTLVQRHQGSVHGYCSLSMGCQVDGHPSRSTAEVDGRSNEFRRDQLLEPSLLNPVRTVHANDSVVDRCLLIAHPLFIDLMLDCGGFTFRRAVVSKDAIPTAKLSFATNANQCISRRMKFKAPSAGTSEDISKCFENPSCAFCVG